MINLKVSESSYTVLLCVDYDEKVLRRYNELFQLCEIQGGTTQQKNNLYIQQRSLRVTRERSIQYNLVLALGGEDASDIAWSIYREGGQIAVAFFDLQCDSEDMLPVIRSLRETFPALICAVALAADQSKRVTRPGDLFTSPSEWLYFSNDYTPEQMEQLIAHLISSFVLHREKEVALAKNEATREGLRQILDASPELLKNQSEHQLATIILKTIRMLTGSSNTYLLVLDQEKKQLRYVAGTGDFMKESDFMRQEYAAKESFYYKTLQDTKIVRSFDGLLAPLWVQDKPVGLLFFDREHLLTRGTELSDVLAHQVAFAIENRRMQREIEQKQAMEHELNLASRIQQSLLPKSFPEMPGVELYGLTKSAKEIGGDYFDVLASGDNFYFCIGDVSGKGVPAGLIMSELRSIVRSFASSHDSPREILMYTAQLLLQDIGGSGKFVSMLLFRWDGEKLLYSSAGHEHILHYHHDSGDCHAYRSGGVVLGVDFRNFSRLLKEKSLPWQPGDVILLFTDGATEANNENKEMFKIDRLQRAVEKYHDLSVQAMIEAILDDIIEFTGDVEQHDDITLLAIKYLQG